MGRIGTMRLCAISYLIAHSRSQLEFSSIGKMRCQFTGKTEQDMAFLTPVISLISCRVFNHANPDAIAFGPKKLSSPRCETLIAFMTRRFNICPIRGAESDVAHFHF
jgi:hypothetical protein